MALTELWNAGELSEPPHDGPSATWLEPTRAPGTNSAGQPNMTAAWRTSASNKSNPQFPWRIYILSYT